MVEDLLLLCFCHIGTVMFTLETSLPHFDVCLLLLDQADQTFIFIDQVRVLGEQDFDLFLEFIEFFQFPVQEENFFVECKDIRLEFFGPSSPIIFVGVGIVVAGGAPGVDDGLVGGLVEVPFLVVFDAADWTVTHF